MTKDISEFIETFEEQCRKGGASKKELEKVGGNNPEIALTKAQEEYLSNIVRIIRYDLFVERLGYIG